MPSFTAYPDDRGHATGACWSIGDISWNLSADEDGQLNYDPAIGRWQQRTATGLETLAFVSEIAGAFVPTTRAINTTAPLTGGGDLSADRTLGISDATTSAKGAVELATDGENAANVVVQGNDSRLSDARTPTTHHTSHEPGGSDAMAADAAAGTASLRSLGSSSTSACAGNDSRLSDARTPTAHASSHNAGGSDALAIDAAAGTGSLRTLGTSGTSACAGNDSRLSDSRAPSGSASGVLSGTYPSPGFASITGTSVLARAAASSGAPAAVGPAGSDEVLRESGGILGFGQVDSGGIAALSVLTGKINANAVTNAKLAQMASRTLKGNAGASTADPSDLAPGDARKITASNVISADETIAADTTMCVADELSLAGAGVELAIDGHLLVI